MRHERVMALGGLPIAAGLLALRSEATRPGEPPPTLWRKGGSWPWRTFFPGPSYSQRLWGFGPELPGSSSNGLAEAAPLRSAGSRAGALRGRKTDVRFAALQARTAVFNHPILGTRRLTKLIIPSRPQCRAVSAVVAVLAAAVPEGMGATAHVRAQVFRLLQKGWSHDVSKLEPPARRKRRELTEAWRAPRRPAQRRPRRRSHRCGCHAQTRSRCALGSAFDCKSSSTAPWACSAGAPLVWASPPAGAAYILDCRASLLHPVMASPKPRSSCGTKQVLQRCGFSSPISLAAPTPLRDRRTGKKQAGKHPTIVRS